MSTPFVEEEFKDDSYYEVLGPIESAAEKAYIHAHNVIRGRWVEGEPIILLSPWSAFKYAECIIKGPWPEAESIIMTEPQYAACYAEYVLKARWPEAEAIIADGLYAQQYNDFVKTL
jgi:hypothetical protein